MIKVMKQVAKVAQEEKKKVEKEHVDYLKSDEYKKLQQKLQEKDEDDEYRQDPDPEGYELYKKALEDPYDKAFKFSMLVAKQNPECAELQAKFVQICLKKCKSIHSLTLCEQRNS